MMIVMAAVVAEAAVGDQPTALRQPYPQRHQQLVQVGERVTFELTASEAITGFTSSDVSVAGGELLSFTAVSATRYDVEIMVDNSTTAPSITIAAGAFDDAAGNDNAEFSSAATRASVQNTTLWLPDNAFTAGAFDASGYSNFAELRYVGSDISGALSIIGIADDMMISLKAARQVQAI